MQMITIAGRLGKDPKTREAGSSTVTSFSVAVSDRRKVDGEWGEHTTWYQVEIWGTRGERLADFLRKGAFVVAAGMLEADIWHADDGPRLSMKLRNAEVTLGPKQDQGEASGGSRSGGGSPSRSRGRTSQRSRGGFAPPPPHPSNPLGGDGHDDGDGYPPF